MLLHQLLTIAFAIACAYLNKWPVIMFRKTGAVKQMERQFHAGNAAVKILFAFTAYYHSDMVVFFFILLLIQWVVFDIFLNLFTGKPWDYVGKTAWMDRMLQKLGNAGEAKAIIVVGIVVVLNIIIHGKYIT